MTAAGTRGAPFDPFVGMDLSVKRPADLRVVGLALVGGVAVDLALQAGVVGVAGALSVAVASVTLLVSGRLANPQARALAALAPLFGVWLALRTSPWLIVPDVLAAGGVLVLAASYARGGSILALSVPRMLARAIVAAMHGVAGPAFAWRPLAARRPQTARWAPFLRGLALAVPVLVVLGVLLGSADPVFASFFDVPADLPDVMGHLVLVAFGAWATAGLLRLASASASGLARLELPTDRRLGATEATMVLGGLVLLFSAFAGAQVVALAGGAEKVLRTEGLTYAEYARSGFFQLLAVAALTLCTLMTVRAATRLEQTAARRFVVPAEAAVVLTLVVVVSALQRLYLYERAYGLTMLRLYSQVFAVWIALVFVLLGLSMAGVGRERQWFLPVACGAGLVLLLGLNLANPEAVVVTRDLDRARAGLEVDPGYLLELTYGSTDAVPALMANLSALAPPERALVVRDLACSSDLDGHGWTEANLSRQRAEKVRPPYDTCSDKATLRRPSG